MYALAVVATFATDVRYVQRSPPFAISLSNVMVYADPPVTFTRPIFIVRKTFMVMSDTSGNSHVPAPVVTAFGRIVELSFIMIVPADRLMPPPTKEDASSISSVFPFTSKTLRYPLNVMDLQCALEFNGQSRAEFPSNIVSSVVSGTPAPPTPPEEYAQFKGSFHVAVAPSPT